jgi:hypothetical protein
MTRTCRLPMEIFDVMKPLDATIENCGCFIPLKSVLREGNGKVMEDFSDLVRYMKERQEEGEEEAVGRNEDDSSTYASRYSKKRTVTDLEAAEQQVRDGTNDAYHEVEGLDLEIFEPNMEDYSLYLSKIKPDDFRTGNDMTERAVADVVKGTGKKSIRHGLSGFQALILTAMNVYGKRKWVLFQNVDSHIEECATLHEKLSVCMQLVTGKSDSQWQCFYHSFHRSNEFRHSILSLYSKGSM